MWGSRLVRSVTRARGGGPPEVSCTQIDQELNTRLTPPGHSRLSLRPLHNNKFVTTTPKPCIMETNTKSQRTGRLPQ